MGEKTKAAAMPNTGRLTMVERVATALYDATPFKETEGGLDVQSDTYQRMCRLLARAAIQAMREPTDFVLAAAHRNNHPRDIETWQTMIDAALAEDPLPETKGIAAA